MTKDISILIIGAGPTGLMLACELARFGIPFRIIDKNPHPTLTSNATWIQTRTIEILDEINLINKFLERGHKCTSINLYTYGELKTKISLDSLSSKYKFILNIPQSETEKILNEHLNSMHHNVERPVELITVSNKENSVHVLLGHPDGQIEEIEYDWVIACDGANSTVREKSKMPFTREDFSQQFIVADVEMDAAFNPNEINIFFDAGSVLAVFPIRGYKYRINANLHTPGEKYGLNKKELKKMLIERTYQKSQITEISLISPYVTHNKLVKKMRDRSIFFAGDAGHVHSPAGGQGMNLGMQDAYNLAWKLAYVIQGKSKPRLLDSYHLERYPIAKKTVDRTKLITKASLIENFLLIDLRNLGFNILNKRFFLSTKFGDRITQLDYEYKKSSIIEYKTNIDINSPRPGQHAPDVTFGRSSQLYKCLLNTHYNILLFFDYSTNSKIQEELINIQQWANENYADVMQTYFIANKKINNFSNFIFDPDNIIARRYKIEGSAIYVIRPDKYIAYCSKEPTQKNVKNFFENYLLLQK